MTIHTEPSSSKVRSWPIHDCSAGGEPGLDMNPLDLVERNLLLDPVVELRRPRRLMPGDPRRYLQIAAVPEILRDSCSAETVCAYLGGQTRLPRPPLDHPQRRRP